VPVNVLAAKKGKAPNLGNTRIRKDLKGFRPLEMAAEP